MKRAALIVDIILLILLFASCATSKGARDYRRSINGNWQLQTVVSEGIQGKVKVQLFNEADFNCFIGSTWNFTNNNSLGNYNIMQNANECTAIKRNVRWSVYEAKDQPKLFQFKRLDDKLKEIDENGSGFRFTIVQLDKNKMQLRSDVNFEGKPAAFIYNFVKI
jgi:ABC-type multidrug transport system fused ATPase/permease subunit